MLGAVLKRFRRKHGRPADVAGPDDRLARAAALHREGQFAEAAALCREHLAARPHDPDALQTLAAALLAQGRAHEGLQCLREAAERAPQNAALHVNLGIVYSAIGQIENALASYESATRCPDASVDAWLQLAGLLKALGRYDETERYCREALEANGENSALRHALSGAFFEQGRVAEAIDELRKSLALNADAPAVHSDFLRALNYLETDRDLIFREHAAWGRRHAQPLAQAEPRFGHLHDPLKRLRVGYVSPYFRKHAVTFFLESVIEHHDRTRFDIVLYADVARPDEYSERLKSYGSTWRSTVGVSDQALADRVREDGVDVLVDLSGHTPNNRLLAFARRAAPVQVTWNGYPNTTGMTAMDYRITDAWCDPPGQTEHLHTEALIRLPYIFMSWRPPADAPDPGPPPAERAGFVTFGSFNSCYKITPDVIALWSHVLERVAGSRLLLLAVPEGRAAERIRRGFDARGIAADRLDIRTRVTHEEFLALHREVDVALDTFPYHGTTTTCFSLWMGLPVVVLSGTTHVSRVGVSLLSNAGLSELAAATADDYVEIAAGLAQNHQTRTALRANLRERVLCSALTDGKACATALEDAYRTMWQTWCARHPAA